METLNSAEASENDKKDNGVSSSSLSSSSVFFDFILVGAGSSGMGFLAGLLQADFAGTVAVVERGSGDGGHHDDENENNHNNNNNNNSNETAHWYRDSHHRHHDHDNRKRSSCSSHSTMLTASCWGGRMLRVPTGSGLGGTSRIHASLCLAPPADDFVCWNQNNVDDDDDDDDVFCWPEFCRVQLPRSLDCIQQLLDQNQALHVFHHQSHHDQQQAAAWNVTAATTSTSSGNHKKDKDDNETFMNSRTRHDDRVRIIIRKNIPCRCTVTAPDGKYRVNYYKGLVAPLLRRLPKKRAAVLPKTTTTTTTTTTQITWFTGCVVQNLVMEDANANSSRNEECVNSNIAAAAAAGVVRGVKLWNTATQSHQVIYAKRKVILAAGVFGSPTILLTSGLLSSTAGYCTNGGSSNSKSSIITRTRVEKHDEAVPVKQEQGQQQQDQPLLQNDGQNNDNNAEQECWVDLPLMDHVMIPCAMFSWRPLLASQQHLSWNGVQSLHQVDYNVINNKQTNNSNDNNNNNYNKRLLVSRMDATVHADILPSVLVDLLLSRRDWLNIPDWPRRGPPPLVLAGVQTMLAVAVHSLATLLEFVLRWAILWTPLGWILRYHVIVMTIFCMNANTAGNKLSIRRCRRPSLGRSKKTEDHLSPGVEVKIDLPYLKDDQDIVALQAVWQDCKQLVAPPDAIEFFPGPLIRHNFGLFRGYCRAFCLPFFHWCGTLPLGGSILNGHFCVRRFESSLCVCDASVFPRHVSVPPALTCAALGHCLACLLLQEQHDDNG
jgi:choline dehydrogenase-like flavoprotein